MSKILIAVVSLFFIQWIMDTSLAPPALKKVLRAPLIQAYIAYFKQKLDKPGIPPLPA